MKKRDYVAIAGTAVAGSYRYGIGLRSVKDTDNIIEEVAATFRSDFNYKGDVIVNVFDVTEFCGTEYIDGIWCGKGTSTPLELVRTETVS